MQIAIPQINFDQAKESITNKEASVIDIRDELSYETAHIPGATLITKPEDMEAFLKKTPKEQMIICYCYHGNSSQSVVKYLNDLGYKKAVSLRGGFEGWMHGG